MTQAPMTAPGTLTVSFKSPTQSGTPFRHRRVGVAKGDPQERSGNWRGFGHIPQKGRTAGGWATNASGGPKATPFARLRANGWRGRPSSLVRQACTACTEGSPRTECGPGGVPTGYPSRHGRVASGDRRGSGVSPRSATGRAGGPESIRVLTTPHSRAIV